MTAMPTARLYVIPGSHPSLAARLMLEAKGVPYKRVDLVPVVSKAVVRAAGFPDNTVPALKLDGHRVQGSREIARALESFREDPPLFPTDAAERKKVEEAETWGDEVLQPIARRLSWWALRKNRAPMATYSEGARLGIPVGLAVKTGQPIVALSARFNGSTDEACRADLAGLPEALDKIDAWIKEGTLGADPPNAADLQIGTSLRLLMSFEDIRPAIESRPAGEMAMRAVPDFPGRTPPVFPEEWLAPLRAATS